MEKIAIVATVSQEPETNIRFCQYHLDIGVDHIFLFFDKPEENCIGELQQHEDVTCISCTEAHWQELGVERTKILGKRNRANAMFAVRKCRERNIDILASIDGDELLYTEEGFKETVSKAFVHRDALYILPYEAVHDKNSIGAGPFAHRYFKVIPNRLNRYLVPLFYWRIRNVTDNGFFGHLIGKTMFRIDAEIVEFDNTHRPKFGNPSKVSKVDAVKLLHFDCAQEAGWIHKWSMRFTGDAQATMRPKRERQHYEIKEAFEGSAQQVRAVYRNFFFLNNFALAIGRCIGLIRRFDISTPRGSQSR